MDSVEDYAIQWTIGEMDDLDTLSERVKSVRSLIQIIIKKLSGSIRTRSTSIFKDPNATKHLYLLTVFDTVEICGLQIFSSTVPPNSNINKLPKKSLQMPRGNQNPYIKEEQTIQWPKEKVHTYL